MDSDDSETAETAEVIAASALHRLEAASPSLPEQRSPGWHLVRRGRNNYRVAFPILPAVPGQFKVIRDDARGWRVTTTAYRYQILDEHDGKLTA